MGRTPAASSGLRLQALPAHVIKRMLGFLDDNDDLIAAYRSSRLFGVARELLQRVRVRELANAHALVAVSGPNPINLLSAFVDEDGAVHTCGDRNFFAPNRGDYPPLLADSLVPALVGSLSHVRVRCVAAGNFHLLALSEDGAVHACGSNRSGELGLGDRLAREHFVQLVAPGGEPVVCVAAGRECSVALSADGTAYGWGDARTMFGHSALVPRLIDELKGVRLGGAATGSSHALFLSTCGDVYSCGLGTFGQLGHGDTLKECRPRRINALMGVRAVHVNVSPLHSLVVDAAGAVYSFGYGLCGCLGHGDANDQLVPKRIEALSNVHAVRASASNGRSAVVSADGGVHRFGQWCVESTRTLHLPERVSALQDKRVISCSLGDSHVLFVTEDGCVYSCGEYSGALGHDLKTEFHHPERLLWPTRVNDLPLLWRASHY